MYQVQEFATMAGVTVRALHHYDRLGLLKPLRRSRTGYRIYRDTDFARLEQIVVLKFLGLPLRDIGPLLKKSSNLKDTLRKQRHVLWERRRQLDAALIAIEKAEQSLNSDEPDWQLFTAVVKEIEMRSDTEWTKKYYSEGAQATVESRTVLMDSATALPAGVGRSNTDASRRNRALPVRTLACLSVLAVRDDQELASAWSVHGKRRHG